MKSLNKLESYDSAPGPSNYPPMQAPPPMSAGRANRTAVLTTTLYAIVVMALAFWGGYTLFGWARDRVVGQLPVFNNSAAAVIAETGVDAAVAGAPESAGTPAVEAVPRTPPVNILLLGTDERPDEGGPQRTDTIILATLDLESQTAGMLSIPRDLYVPLASTGITTKINTAYGIGVGQQYPGGGPQLVMDTVSSIVGQPVPYYVRVNFDGFVQIVDLIGGIDINVPKTIYDDDYPTATEGITETFSLDAGFQHMDGATALKYARTRNVDDDYGRSGRQQDVIRAVLDRVRSADMIPTLLANAPALLNTLRTSIETNIPIAKVIELATYVNDNPPREIRQLVLDSRYGEETYSPEGMWILLPDRQKVRAAVNTFFTPPAATPDAAVAAAVDPTTVNLEVLNGTGVPGMAAKTRDLLAGQGWNIVSIGDADRGDYAQSVLINYGVSDTMIQQVSSALGLPLAIASVSGLNEDTHIDARIVIGQDVLPLLNP